MQFFSTRWRKVWRDILDNKARTGLVVMAIAVGVFAFGSMFITREVLLTNMNQGFSATNPATVTINVDGFDESLVRTVQNFPYVMEVEARTTRQVQVWTGTTWMSLQMIAVPNFDEITINTLGLEQGNLDPQRRQIIFERQSITQIVDAELGDTVQIELLDNTQKEMTITGVVHDFNAIPGQQIPVLTGYVSLDTLRLYDLSDQFDELKIVTPPDLQTEEQLEVAADVISDRLTRYGYGITGTSINEPGKHWGADLITAIVLVLVIIGLLALGLAGFLVVNTITGLLAQQKRQIGMMKAVGATTNDVMGIYLAMAGVYGILSLIVALPLGILLSRGMSAILANFLNINIVAFEPPLWVLGLQFIAAIVTPLVAAIIPIIAGARTTVRETISDYGISQATGASTGLLDKILMALKGVSRPVLLSLRNTFRRRGRLILTVVTLAIAGAMFIAVVNARVSILGEFESVLNMFGYDVQIVVIPPESDDRLRREAMRVPGVTSAEGWGIANVTIIRPDGVIAPEVEGVPGGPGGPPRLASVDENAGTELTIFAPPFDTPFMDPTILEGRWLQEGDTNAIVLGSEVLSSEPYINVGDEIELDFGDQKRTVEVVGIVSLVGPDFGYATFDWITRVEGAPGKSFVAVLGTTSHDLDFQEKVARDVEERFQEIGIGVLQADTPASFIGVISNLVDFFVYFMLFMALLLGVVGGLGLASTMSLNVLERTREIGVMRAIGASDLATRLIFLAEGLLIGVMSYGIAFVLSFPISYAFVYFVGLAFFQRPIALQLTWVGIAAWFVLVLMIAAAASLAPANRAASISVRESLAYE